MASLGWTTGRAVELVSGSLIGAADVAFDRVVIDSREDVRGALFVALRGERHDGHEFAAGAAQRGAAALLVEQPIPDVTAPQIRVADSLAALQALGRARRAEFRGPVVGITGSSGKTTTRKLVAALLGRRGHIHQPVKNFNNHVGVPLTLLGLGPAHDAAVIELGCSDFGEIALLTSLADPDVALVTNVGPAHLEKLGDLDGVARAKGELFAGVREAATAVRFVDDPRVAAMPVSAGSTVTYGAGEKPDVGLLARRPAPGVQLLTLRARGGQLTARLPLLGAHNAINATAALAVALAVWPDLEAPADGLADARAEDGRLCPQPGPSGATVIDDTYNANPASTAAALDVLAEQATDGRPFAVLADMLELGDSAEQAHRVLGHAVAQIPGVHLVGVGPGGAFIRDGAVEAGLPADRCAATADHREAAARVLDARPVAGDVILVKGSRGMAMEQVVQHLREDEG